VQIHDRNFTLVDENVQILVVAIDPIRSGGAMGWASD